MNRIRIVLIIILILSTLNILLSSYLTYSHFKFRQLPEYKSGCAWFTGGKEDPCKIVSTSKYSRMFGLPVALYGMFYFLFIFCGTIFYLFVKNKIIPPILFLVSGLGVLSYIYLTYLEFFVIHAVCPLCVITFILHLGIFFGIIYILKKKEAIYEI